MQPMGNNGFDSLPRLHELLIPRATPEQRQRLNRLTGGGPPSTAYKPVENSLYLAEAVAVAFEQVFREQREQREMLEALMEFDQTKKGRRG
jgi:hypothetical protein